MNRPEKYAEFTWVNAIFDGLLRVYDPRALSRQYVNGTPFADMVGAKRIAR